MTPGPLREKVVAERSEWVREMLERIRALPTEHLSDFEDVLGGMHRWIGNHPEKLDRTL